MATPQATTDRAISIRNILCPVDFSDFSASVLAYAAGIAKLFGSEITVLHVFAPAVPPGGLAADPGWLLNLPDARAALADELERLAAPLASDGVVVRTAQVEGSAAAEIVGEATERDADLLVMGTHGRSGFDRLALGSVAEKVLRKSPCPVLTIPPGAARTASDVSLKRLLCPTDFSPCSEHATDFALAFADRTDAAVTSLHVVETLEARPELSTAMSDMQRRQCETEQRYLEKLNAARAGSHRLTSVVALGKPYVEILRRADEGAMDLIVMGVRGRAMFDLALFGSTANQVVRRATCPVLTVGAPRQRE